MELNKLSKCHYLSQLFPVTGEFRHQTKPCSRARHQYLRVAGTGHPTLDAFNQRYCIRVAADLVAFDSEHWRCGRGRAIDRITTCAKRCERGFVVVISLGGACERCRNTSGNFVIVFPSKLSYTLQPPTAVLPNTSIRMERGYSPC